MSLFAWAAFVICAVAVVLHYVNVRDDRFLIFAIPGLIALLLIPMALAWMSRRMLTRAAAEHVQNAKPYKIGKITLATTGQAVRISGEVQNVSFKWLNRPHFQIKDGTGTIRVIMFTAPPEDIKPGDRVDVLGVGIKNIFDRRNAAISAVRIQKA